MFRKKNEWHDGERYPGGRKSLPFGTALPKVKKQNQTRSAKAPWRVPRIRWRIDRSTIEKCFMISIFIVLEVMSYRVFFGVFESVFNGHNFPEMLRSVLKMAQLAMFIFFTYANIMSCFFKINIFNG